MLFSTIVFVLLNVKSKFVPGFEDEALGAVFSVLAQLVAFQYKEGLVDTVYLLQI